LTVNVGKLEEVSAAAHQLDFFTNTGFSVHYKTDQEPYDLPELIYSAVEQVIKQHPILFAVPVLPKGEAAYWGRLPSIDVTKAVSFVERSQPSPTTADGRDPELDGLLEKQHNTSFKDGYGTLPVWRLIILQGPGVKTEFTAIFIGHHSMSDGTGSQVFQNSFQKALNELAASELHVKGGHNVYSDENDPIAPSLEEVHPLPLSPNPPSAAPLPNDWTGGPVAIPCKTRYASLSLPPTALKALAPEWRKLKIAQAAAIPAIIASLLYKQLPSHFEALTLNLPVSLRNDLPPHLVEGKLGNYIDAFKVKLPRHKPSSDASATSVDPEEVATYARKVSAETRGYFANTSPTGEAYTNIAFFRFIPDLGAAIHGTLGTARGESFEVSNLGTFTEPAGSKPWRAGKVLLGRCAYAAGGPLVVCVITGEENVGGGFTWQEGAVADAIVENVLEGVRAYFSS
jgi:hypothetical protein